MCDVCGKRHTRISGDIFKFVWKNKTKHMCGYNCYNKIVTLKHNKQNDEIDKIFNSIHNSQ